jgi:hypothetical protein
VRGDVSGVGGGGGGGMRVGEGMQSIGALRPRQPRASNERN